MKKEILSFTVKEPKHRAHRVLFQCNTPFKPKVVQSEKGKTKKRTAQVQAQARPKVRPLVLEDVLIRRDATELDPCCELSANAGRERHIKNMRIKNLFRGYGIEEYVVKFNCSIDNYKLKLDYF